MIVKGKEDMEMGISIHFVTKAIAVILAVVVTAGIALTVVLYQIGKKSHRYRTCGKRNT